MPGLRLFVPVCQQFPLAMPAFRAFSRRSHGISASIGIFLIFIHSPHYAQKSRHNRICLFLCFHFLHRIKVLPLFLAGQSRAHCFCTNPAFFVGHDWICTNIRGTSPQTNCRPRSLFAPHDHVTHRHMFYYPIDLHYSQTPRRHFSSFRAVYIERIKENEEVYALIL